MRTSTSLIRKLSKTNEISKISKSRTSEISKLSKTNGMRNKANLNGYNI